MMYVWGLLIDHSYKTAVLENCCTSNLQPCDNQIRVREIFSQAPKCQHCPALTLLYSTAMLVGDNVGETLFIRTAEDNKLTASMEDINFQQLGRTLAFPVAQAMAAQQQEAGIRSPHEGVSQLQPWPT